MGVERGIAGYGEAISRQVFVNSRGYPLRPPTQPPSIRPTQQDNLRRSREASAFVEAAIIHSGCLQAGVVRCCSLIASRSALYLRA